MEASVPIANGTLSAEEAYASLQREPVDKQLETVTKQFEAIFLRQFLKEALEPMIKGALNEGGSANETYRYFLIDSMAESMTQSEGLGFSSLLHAQLSESLPKAETENLEE